MEPFKIPHMHQETSDILDRLNPQILLNTRKWPQVIAVVGALGSGKTEWILNLATALSQEEHPGILSDLDIINPYFCLRSISKQLKNQHLFVLTPPEELQWGEMTYINPKIRDNLENKKFRSFLDVGGNPEGTLALKQFETEIKRAGYDLHLVINPYRIQTQTLEDAVSMRTKIEAICGLNITGIIANAHLGEQTTPHDCAHGTLAVWEMAQKLDIPFVYALAEQKIAPRVRLLLHEGIHLWPLTRRILLPWENHSAPKELR